jgi:hypothetical protein
MHFATVLLFPQPFSDGFGFAQLSKHAVAFYSREVAL